MQPAKGGRAGLTSDMAVVGEEVCHSVTRCRVRQLSHHKVIHKLQAEGMANNRKGRKRSDYAYFLSYRTRWFVILTRTVVLRGELRLQIQE